MPIIRIVSGGQTGADRGGLEAAIHCRLPHGGWCPKGRRSEDGTIPPQYILREMPSADYLARTEANVADSDCTVIFSYGALEGGSLKTSEFAKKLKKPWLHVDVDVFNRTAAVTMIVQWLQNACPKDCILNVAGQRGSKAPLIAGVVKAWMVDVISKVNGTMFYPIGEEFYEEDPLPRKSIEEIAGPQLATLSKELHQQAAEMTLYHPRTIDEAVEIVLMALSVEKKDMIRDQSREDFCAFAHFGLGMGIRNCMMFQNENLIDLMADFQKGCREGRWEGFAEPDSVSGVIVGLVWDRLQAG